jgi:hypothetical protein
MKMTIESTTRIVNASGVDCRVWEGVTERGVKVQVLVPRVAALADQDLRQFQEELAEQRAPSVAQAFPLRLIL